MSLFISSQYCIVFAIYFQFYFPFLLSSFMLVSQISGYEMKKCQTMWFIVVDACVQGIYVLSSFSLLKNAYLVLVDAISGGKV